MSVRTTDLRAFLYAAVARASVEAMAWTPLRLWNRIVVALRSQRLLTALSCLLLTAGSASAQTVLYNFNNAARHPSGGLVASGPFLYGTTSLGGPYGNGVLFRIDPATSVVTGLAAFTLSNGVAANDLLVSGSVLYGTAQIGGTNNKGTVFKFDPATNLLSTVISFNGTNGASPGSGLIASGALLYGTTSGGGTYGSGTVFKIDPSTGTLTTLASFNPATDGYNPYGGVLASGSLLYGTTFSGGPNGVGTIYSLNPTLSTPVIATLASFSSTNGSNPAAGLVASGSFFYGTTSAGNSGNGRVFRFDPSNNTISTLLSFAGNGSAPFGDLTAIGSVLFGTTQRGGASGGGVVYKIDAGTSAVTVLASFSSSSGRTPEGRLTAIGSVLYGASSLGGSKGQGTVFKFDSATNALTALFSFNPVGEGARPTGGLVASGSYLYGATSAAGTDVGSLFKVDPATGTVTEPIASQGSSGSLLSASAFFYGTCGLSTVVITSLNQSFITGCGYGSVFKFDPIPQTATTVASFDSSNGAVPEAGLAALGSLFYGTTHYGGANGLGAVYSVNPATNAITRLVSFSGAANGQFPSSDLVVVGSLLYGTTQSGGANGFGTVFAIDAAGTLQTMATFDGSNGRYPMAGLTVSGSALYGTTSDGGTAATGGTRGTVFKLVSFPASPTLTTVKSFNGTTGDSPAAPLLSMASYLYGTTSGGVGHFGTIFKLSPASGALATLGSFNDDNGSAPTSALVSSGSLLYGTASSGGTWGGGVVFSIDPNVKPAITAGGPLTRTAGVAPFSANIATVSDFEDAAGSLTVTALNLPAGITVDTISNSGGSVTASVGATCSAQPGTNTVSLQVLDSAGALVTANLTVNVLQGDCFGTPKGFTATRLSSTAIRLNWNPVGGGTSYYEVSRDSPDGPFTTFAFSIPFTDSEVAPNTVYSYKVRAVRTVNGVQQPSDFSVPDLATTIAFTDDPISAQTTWVKAIHVTELRGAVNAVRAIAKIGAFSFADTSLADQPVKALHFAQLRAALGEARNALFLPALTYSNALTAQTSSIKEIDLREIRDGMK